MVVEVKPEIVVTPAEEYTPAAKELYRARQQISSPEKWCKGISIKFMPDGGFQFCMIGALWFDERGAHHPEDVAALSRAESILYLSLNSPRGVPEWNDDPDRTHDEVLAMFDRAINRALELGE